MATESVQVTTRKRKTKAEKALEKANKPPINSLADIKTLNDIEFPFVIAHVKSQGAEDKKWLKDLAATTGLTDKNGKARRMSFIEIRKEFAIRYLPHLAPQAKEKKPTMYDLIDEI